MKPPAASLTEDRHARLERVPRDRRQLLVERALVAREAVQDAPGRRGVKKGERRAEEARGGGGVEGRGAAQRGREEAERARERDRQDRGRQGAIGGDPLGVLLLRGRR